MQEEREYEEGNGSDEYAKEQKRMDSFTTAFTRVQMTIFGCLNLQLSDDGCECEGFCLCTEHLDRDGTFLEGDGQESIDCEIARHTRDMNEQT